MSEVAERNDTLPSPMLHGATSPKLVALLVAQLMHDDHLQCRTWRRHRNAAYESLDANRQILGLAAGLWNKSSETLKTFEY